MFQWCVSSTSDWRACRTALQPQVWAFKLPKEITARVLISLVFMVMVPYFPAIAEHILLLLLALKGCVLQPFLRTPHLLYKQSVIWYVWCFPESQLITTLSTIHSPWWSKFLTDSCPHLRGQGIGTWPRVGYLSYSSSSSAFPTDIYPMSLPTKPLLHI